MSQSELITMLSDFIHKLPSTLRVEEIDLILCRWMLDNNIIIVGPPAPGE